MVSLGNSVAFLPSRRCRVVVLLGSSVAGPTTPACAIRLGHPFTANPCWFDDTDANLGKFASTTGSTSPQPYRRKYFARCVLGRSCRRPMKPKRVGDGLESSGPGALKQQTTRMTIFQWPSAAIGNMCQFSGLGFFLHSILNSAHSV